jgi:hypothetical protein
MGTSDKEKVPQVLATPRDPAHTDSEVTVDTSKSSAPHAHPPAGGQDHPHACLNGYVYLGYTALDEETGEEVERVEALPCRRCASEASR